MVLAEFDTIKGKRERATSRRHCFTGRTMGSRKKKGIDRADCRTVRGRLYVRVEWDDVSKGASHYVPVSQLKCLTVPVAGAVVEMRHTKGKKWRGKITHSDRYLAASSLVSGERTAALVVR